MELSENGNYILEIKQILTQARQNAYRAVNTSMVPLSFDKNSLLWKVMSSSPLNFHDQRDCQKFFISSSNRFPLMMMSLLGLKRLIMMLPRSA